MQWLESGTWVVPTRVRRRLPSIDHSPWVEEPFHRWEPTDRFDARSGDPWVPLAKVEHRFAAIDFHPQWDIRRLGCVESTNIPRMERDPKRRLIEDYGFPEAVVNQLPADVVLHIARQGLNVTDIENLCRATGTDGIFIFERYFVGMYGRPEWDALRARHPEFRNYAWMIRAYELGYHFTENFCLSGNTEKLPEVAMRIDNEAFSFQREADNSIGFYHYDVNEIRVRYLRQIVNDLNRVYEHQFFILAEEEVIIDNRSIGERRTLRLSHLFETFFYGLFRAGFTLSNAITHRNEGARYDDRDVDYLKSKV